MASIREWLKGHDSKPSRVVVVHCKAGKGRSGTIACSYMISQEGWSVKDALDRFTERRMRTGFGAGISIPSQQRWIKYVKFWTDHGKVYVDRPVEVLEVHVWGLRDGVRIAVEGYVEDGKKIKTFNTFTKDEKTVMDDLAIPTRQTSGLSPAADSPITPIDGRTLSPSSTGSSSKIDDKGAKAALFRPSRPLVIPNSDISIDIERRNKATVGFTMVTSVAHVWFNTFFEEQFSTTSPENASENASNTNPPSAVPSGTVQIPSSGVFTINWDAMDGIKGSARKGTKALDRLSVVWRTVENPRDGGLTKIITQPPTGTDVADTGATNWQTGAGTPPASVGKKLGLRVETTNSATVSKASSITSADPNAQKADYSSDVDEGVKTHGPEGEEHVPPSDSASQGKAAYESARPSQSDGAAVEDHAGASGSNVDKVRDETGAENTAGLPKKEVAGIVEGLKAVDVAGNQDKDERSA